MKTVAMPPYNPAAKCPKCLSDDVSSIYRPNGYAAPYPERDSWQIVHEFLRRTCRRCHYGWNEAVA